MNCRHRKTALFANAALFPQGAFSAGSAASAALRPAVEANVAKPHSLACQYLTDLCRIAELFTCV